MMIAQLHFTFVALQAGLELALDRKAHVSVHHQEVVSLLH
jgi:hypothetical protein